MEKEISSAATLGIVLIALAAVIGLGFGVFSIAKSTANEGTTGVQESISAVSQQAYDDYDQKIVTGSQVITALKTFSGKEVAVLVATTSTKDNLGAGTFGEDGKIVAGKAGSGYTGESSDTSDTTNADTVKYVAAYTDSDAGTAYKMYGSDTSKPVVAAGYINYNAILADSTDGTTAVDSYIYWSNNCFVNPNGFYSPDSIVQYNYITENMSKSGMMEYVSTGARFQAYLITDASGTTQGVAFNQL